MIEKEIEDRFTKTADSLGCLCLKLRIDGSNGWPDRTVVTPKGVLFFEFKTPLVRLRPMQRVWKKLLQGLGYQYHVVRKIDEAEAILREFLK